MGRSQLFFGHVFAVQSDFVWEIVVGLIVWVQTEVAEFVEAQVPQVECKVDEACHVGSSLWEVLPQALQTQHQVDAASEDKEQEEGVGLVIVFRRKRSPEANELDDHCKQDQTLYVDLELCEQ